ncbi:MAG: FAD-binding oxidoreductase [Pseudonocardiales bacterium]|nr:FAD-binding oxidoreductase [Pseudonocardiales bacterium]
MQQIPGIEALRAQLTGRVIDKSDLDYDTACSLWNGAIDHRPAAVARCTGPSDVAATIAFGRERGLQVLVRGGAHGYWATAVPENDLVIDLSDLRGVSVDPGSRRVWCGGGAILADLDAATQRHGLAVPGGVISHIGVSGLALGGGFGWLVHKAGLTVDNLLSAEVVTADGRTLGVSAGKHSDLFWALRGGGGNFGVVTGFEFRLHEVGPLVHLGLFFWGAEHGAEALRLGREVAASLPRDAGLLLATGLTAPSAPFVPERHHGRLGYALMVTGFSTARRHQRLIAPIREALPPLFELVTSLPYVELQKMFDSVAPWGLHAYGKGLYLQELSDEVIAVLTERIPGKSSPMSLISIFSLGGAFADVAEQETAFGGSRTTRFVLNLTALAPDAESLAPDHAWVDSVWQALAPYAGEPGSSVNSMADYDEKGVQAAYGSAKYQRLARIKARYDPENVFRMNVNIKPAPQPSAGGSLIAG